MGRFRLAVGVMCLVLATSVAAAAAPPADEVGALAARIDQLIETGYAEAKAKPAPLADDAEFVRRVYLDVAGRIPRVAEVHKFLDDKSPEQAPRPRGGFAPRTPLRQPFHQCLARPAVAAEQQSTGAVPGRTDRRLGASTAARQQTVRPDGARAAHRAGGLQPRHESCATGPTLARSPSTRPTRASRRMSPHPPPGCSWASSSNALNATITPSRAGAASSSGNTPPSSPASARSSRRTASSRKSSTIPRNAKSRSPIATKPSRRTSSMARSRSGRVPRPPAPRWPSG